MPALGPRLLRANKKRHQPPVEDSEESHTYPQPLLLGEGVAVVHVPALARPPAEYLLLLFLTRQPLHLGVVFNNPGGQLIFLHEARLALWVPGVLPPPVHVHALRTGTEVSSVRERLGTAHTSPPKAAGSLSACPTGTLSGGRASLFPSFVPIAEIYVCT